MGYERQNFVDDTTLFASQLNHIEQGIVYLEEAKLPKTGGEMTGPINMNGQGLTGLNPPTEDTDAANKGYADQAASKASSPLNILDNSYFINPVNRRGQTNYSGAGYTIDRWGINGGTMEVNNGISFTVAYTLFQMLEKNIADGVKRTLALGTNDGSVYCQTIEAGYIALGNSGYQVTYDTGSAVYINRTSENALPIEWVALYEGKYTLETLPEYVPKPRIVEIMACLQYDPVTGDFIGMPSSKRNLLDNSYFINPVNQRNIARGALSDQYIIDRWYLWYGATITLNDKGLTISDITGEKTTLLQYLGETPQFPVTLSVQTTTGVYTAVAEAPGNTVHFDGLYLVCPTLSSSKQKYYVEIGIHKGSDVTIKNVSLYEGVYSDETILQYVEPNPTLELIKCKRYLQHFGSNGSLPIAVGIATTTTSAVFPFSADVSMRITPSLKYSGLSIGNGTATPTGITGITLSHIDASYEKMRLNVTATGLTVGKAYFLYIGSGGYLELNAEL